VSLIKILQAVTAILMAFDSNRMQIEVEVHLRTLYLSLEALLRLKRAGALRLLSTHALSTHNSVELVFVSHFHVIPHGSE
jgi:hypothetical protein